VDGGGVSGALVYTRRMGVAARGRSSAKLETGNQKLETGKEKRDFSLRRPTPSSRKTIRDANDANDSVWVAQVQANVGAKARTPKALVAGGDG